MLTYEQAKANPLVTDWDNLAIAVPWFVGRRVVTEERFRATGVYGFWPANSIGDDIVVYKDDARNVELARFHMLRQQDPVAGGGPNLSLADFVAPKESMAPDYIGAFVLAARDGEAAENHAQAFAGQVHAQAWHDWGLATGDRGIRVTFGSPECPDHSQKATLFRLLDAQAVGLTLTEDFSVRPAASMVGLYFSHPQSKGFSVGRIGPDQLEDYADRRNVPVAEASRWLGGSVLLFE